MKRDNPYDSLVGFISRYSITSKGEDRLREIIKEIIAYESSPLPVTGESEAIEKAIIEELQSILSSGVHPEYLPEKINDRIAELKGDKSYT